MTRHPALPDDQSATAINADFLAGRITHTGWWDELGRPAPWPDDLDDWSPSSSEPLTRPTGEQHF